MATGCQSLLRGPAITSPTNEPYTAAPGILIHQHLAKLSTWKETILPLSFSLDCLCAQAAISRVIDLTWLSAPEWQQTDLWTLPPQLTGKRTAGRMAHNPFPYLDQLHLKTAQ